MTVASILDPTNRLLSCAQPLKSGSTSGKLGCIAADRTQCFIGVQVESRISDKMCTFHRCLLDIARHTADYVAGIMINEIWDISVVGSAKRFPRLAMFVLTFIDLTWQHGSFVRPCASASVGHNVRLPTANKRLDLEMPILVHMHVEKVPTPANFGTYACWKGTYARQFWYICMLKRYLRPPILVHMHVEKVPTPANFGTYACWKDTYARQFHPNRQRPWSSC